MITNKKTVECGVLDLQKNRGIKEIRIGISEELDGPKYWIEYFINGIWEKSQTYYQIPRVLRFLEKESLVWVTEPDDLAV